METMEREEIVETVVAVVVEKIRDVEPNPKLSG